MACLLFKILESIAKPISVKQKGRYRNPCLSELEVTNRDLQFSNSPLFISNIKSSGKRSMFHNKIKWIIRTKYTSS